MQDAGDRPKLNRRHLLALGLVVPAAGAAGQAAAWPRRKPKTPAPPAPAPAPAKPGAQAAAAAAPKPAAPPAKAS